MKIGIGLASLAVLALACLFAVKPAPGKGRELSAKQAGPRPQPRVEGSVLASSFDELSRLVADPAGPRDITVASGVHRGNLRIKRPVALRGEAGATLEGLGTDSVLVIDATDVTVEDLTVRHSGRRHSAEDTGIKAQGERVRIARVKVEDSLFGVRLSQCKSCELEGLHVVGWDDDAELRGDGIKLWESHGSSVRDCLVERSRDVVVWYTKHATLERVTVRHSRYGAHFMYAHDSVVRNSHFEHNVVGVFVMYSMRVRAEDNVLAGAKGAAGIGIGFKDSDAVEVHRNWFVANTKGAYLDNTPRTEADPVTLSGNVFALNDVALGFHSTERGLHINGNDFRDNAQVIDVEGGGDALSADVKGNHYSDYEGYDLDHDGIGDVPFEIKALSTGLLADRPPVRFFHGTAAVGVLDAVARAVPVLGSRKLLVDPAPLFDAPAVKQP